MQLPRTYSSFESSFNHVTVKYFIPMIHLASSGNRLNWLEGMAKKFVQQDHSLFGAWSVRSIHKHDKMKRAPLVTFPKHAHHVTSYMFNNPIQSKKLAYSPKFGQCQRLSICAITSCDQRTGVRAQTTFASFSTAIFLSSGLPLISSARTALISFTLVT